MRDLWLASGTLGSIYRCRMFYGNGTARGWCAIRLANDPGRPAFSTAVSVRMCSETPRASGFGDIGAEVPIVSADPVPKNRSPDASCSMMPRRAGARDSSFRK